MYKIICVWLNILLLTLSVHCDLPTQRQTVNGPVEGIEQVSSLGQTYYAFKGVPFAESPITGTDPFTGEHVDRRFKPPQPLERHWTEKLIVQNYSKRCMIDYDLDDVPDCSEDCLYLNIYVPSDGVESKTVLVYIHGGGFVAGGASDTILGPDFLLSQDNVVVTLQYRLGIYGFLNLNFTEYTGNMGLKDQQLALKWIHENIEHFSGNKDEILLFGQSSGAVSVQLHMINAESRKYFKRAFSMSGSAYQLYVLRRFDRMKQIQTCTQINDTNEIIAFLKTANNSMLVNCNNNEWIPTIENSNAKAAFLTHTLDSIFNSVELSPKMDAMFSFASQEVPSLANSTAPLIKEDWRETNITLPFDGFTKDAHPKEYAQSVEKLRIAYFPDTTNIKAIRRQNIALESDLVISDSIIKLFTLQANSNNGDNQHYNTFLFRFSVNADLNENYSIDGAAHSDDMCYIFHCHVLDEFNIYEKHLESKDINYEIIMRSLKMITNFARTGDPSIEGDTPFQSSKSSNEIFCQEVSNEMKTSVTTNIKEQMHYDTFREIEKIYNDLNISTTQI